MSVTPRPSVRRVLSERAERWIIGDLDTTTYFAVGRGEAAEAARIEVVARLNRDRRWDASPRPGRPAG